MHRPTVIVLLAILVPACSLMPAKSEHVRARQMEDAVLPMAATALETGQVETARRLYRRLLDIDPESMPARMGLGDVALQERDTAAAARWYLSALTRAGEPEDRRRALLAHGRAALAAGQLEAARESFTRLTEPGENAPRASVAWGHNGTGLTLLLEGDLHGAVAAMERAVLRAPEEQRFRANLDRALAMLSEFPAPEVSSNDRQDVDVPPVGQRDDNRPGRSLTKPPEPAVAEAKMPGMSVSEDPPLADSTPDSQGEGGTSRLERLDEPPRSEIEEPEKSGRPAADPITVELPLSDEPAVAMADAISGTDASIQLEPERSDHLTVDKDRPLDRDDEPQVEDAPLKPVVSEQVPEAVSPLVTAVETQDREQRASPKPHRSPVTSLDDTKAPSTESVAEVGRVEGVGAGTNEHPPAEEAGPSTQPAMGKIEDGGPSVRAVDESPATGPPSPSPRVLVVTENNLPFLQFGAYAEPANAKSVAARLRDLTGQTVTISENGDRADVPLHRVRIGPIPAPDTLLELIAALEAAGYRIANAPRSSADDGIRNGQAHRPIKTVLVHEAGEQFLQAGAYSERSTAETLARELQGLTDRPVRVSEVARPDGPPLHRVRIGPIEPDDPLIELIGPAD